MEIEAKFAVLSEETFSALRSLVHLGEYDLTPGETLRLYDTYLDTPDRSIYGGGYAFRRRLQDGVALLSLKSLGTVSGGVHHREETEVEEPAGLEGLVPCQWPEGPVRDDICALTEDEPLELLFTVEQERLLRHIVDASGSRVADMALDSGVVSLPNGGLQQPFMELEIELGPRRTDRDLDALLASLATMPGLIPQPTSKFERGLALATRRSVDRPKGHRVRATDTFGRAMSRILMPLFLRMQDHETGSYDGTDPEELHDMRVATRRMRTALWIAEPYLDLDALKRVRKGLSQTAMVLGAVRDMDVFREKTMAYIAEQQVSIGDFAPLFRVWDVEYIGRRNDMLAHLSSKQYAKFKKAFWDHLRAGMPERGSSRRVADLVPSLVRERLTTVLDHGRFLAEAGAPLAAYHALRIDVKRLRYTLEFFRDILGPTAREAITAMQALQDFFGDLQDARVAASHLRAVIGFGSWEEPKQMHTLWSPGMAIAPATAGHASQPASALAIYLADQEARIETLLAQAPIVWRGFLDAGAPALVEQALAPNQTITSIAQRSHSMDRHPTYVILMGPPASGKGTQADRLQESLALPHVASGDLFRYNLKNQTELGLEAKGYMDRGELVPDGLTIAMVLDRLARPDCVNGALLDGFPRTLAQAEALDKALAAQGSAINLVLDVQVPREELIARVTGRRLCRSCGASYHMKFAPPVKDGVCDKCGGELYQRDDDTEATAVKRLEVYEAQTKPLIEYYRNAGLLVGIDGNQPIDVVTDALKAAIEQNL